jgi:phage portal protein BeeE
MANFFTFNGSSYPIGGYSYSKSNTESAPNDFESYVRSAYKGNGIVFACMQARSLIFSEMTFCYQGSNNGRQAERYGSKELSVLENPWPNGTTGELLTRALQDADLAGNHYVVREGFGSSERLRRLRPDWVDILLSAPPDEAVHSDVEAYIYKPGGTTDEEKWEIYPIDGSKGAIAHWSPIPDPTAQYRGMSWITPILREIMADKGATKHKQMFFDQGATPQIAVSFKDTVSPEAFKEFMQQVNTNHEGVDNAYKTMYLAGGADVTVIGAHLQQLDFHNMQGHGETRMAAAAQIHPVLLGLSEALKGTPLAIGNYQAAKDMFGDKFLRPTWRSLCDSYAPLVKKIGGSRLWYEDRDISFLRQDRQAQAELQLAQAQTINTYIMAGFEPDTIVKMMIAEGDLKLLKHSGLTSVQLLPPGQMANGGPPEGGGAGGAKAPPKKAITTGPNPKANPNQES